MYMYIYNMYIYIYTCIKKSMWCPLFDAQIPDAENLTSKFDNSPRSKLSSMFDRWNLPTGMATYPPWNLHVAPARCCTIPKRKHSRLPTESTIHYQGAKKSWFQGGLKESFILGIIRKPLWTWRCRTVGSIPWIVGKELCETSIKSSCCKLVTAQWQRLGKPPGEKSVFSKEHFPKAIQHPSDERFIHLQKYHTKSTIHVGKYTSLMDGMN